MEENPSIVTDRTLAIGVGVSDHLKVHYQFHTMFMKSHQEILYLKEIFQNVHFRLLDAIDHLQNPASVDKTQITTSRTPTSQDCLKMGILYGLDEIAVLTKIANF